MTEYAITYEVPIPKQRSRRADARHREPDSELSKALLALEVGGSFEVLKFREYVALRNRFHAFKPRKFCMREQDAGGWRVWRVL